MSQCTLCLVNNANQTGSHVVPHFLMKMIDNADHVKGRDKELGFKITEDFVAPYFGRDVNTNNLEAVFGELTEDDIANSRSEIIVDYIYCSSCEKKFGRIESAYAPSLKITGFNAYESGNTSLIAFLFWTSVIWRISSSNKLGFKLTMKEENRLRLILNQLLDQETLDENKTSLTRMTRAIRYCIIRSPKFSDKNESAAFYHPSHRFPYCLLIGEFALFYYMKESHIKNPAQVFFGLERYLKVAPINSVVFGENIYGLQSEQFAEVWEALVDFINKRRIKGLFRNLDELHLKLGGIGKQMHPQDKWTILNDIMSEGKELARTFTREDVTRSTIKVLTQKYGLSPE